MFKNGKLELCPFDITRTPANVWLQRGAGEQEIAAAVGEGEQFKAKFGRTGFRRNFVFEKQWRGKYYKTKQVEAYAVREGDDWLVITVIARYF